MDYTLTIILPLMGYQIKKVEPEKKLSPPKDLQRYYTELYRQYNPEPVNPQIAQALSSIYSRTRLPTNTLNNRELALLDIDKILSINTHSLEERGERVKYMRMVAGLVQQSERTTDNPHRQIHHLVSLARLHFITRRRENGRESSEQEAPRTNQ